MRLTDQEKAMLDGAEGPAKQKAMDLLVRYAEALGAERFVDVTNIAGVPGSSTMFLHDYYKEHGGGSFEAFRFSLLCPLARRSRSSMRAMTTASFSSCALA